MLMRRRSHLEATLSAGLTLLIPFGCASNNGGADVGGTASDGAGGASAGSGGEPPFGGGAGSGDRGTDGAGGASGSSSSDGGGEAGSGGDPKCPTGCWVDGTCVPNGTAHPDDPCLACDRAWAAASWSPVSGMVCDDGNFCTVDDTCANGLCAGVSRDCSDGVDCNGEETCDESIDECLAGSNQCPAGQVCDAETDGCVSTCNGCSIDDVCYADGESSPTDPCQVCHPASSTTTWSNGEGMACDDRLFCNGGDVCNEGVCSLHAETPCVDDGLFCNGSESCDETSDSCVHSGSPCSADESCAEETDECCKLNASTLCDSNGDVVSYDSCGQKQDVVNDCVTADLNGLCKDGLCGCTEGRTGEDCQRCLLYVDSDLDDYTGHDGTTWSMAFEHIQPAIDSAAQRESPCAVWVAAGTYAPTAEHGGSGDQYHTFLLKPEVDVYGGFLGDEVALAQRALEKNETVLTADGVADHLVTGADNAVLDGFTLISGDPRAVAIGVYNETASPTIANCTLRGFISDLGAAMVNVDSSPSVADCAFADNKGFEPGGSAMVNLNSSPNVIRCSFTNNSIETSGGAIYNDATSSPTLEECAFSGNSATEGGAIYNLGPSTVISASVFSANRAVERGGAVYNDGAYVSIVGTSFLDNSDNSVSNLDYGYGGAVFNSGDSLVISGSSFSRNSLRGAGGALYNKGTLLSVIGSMFSNNVAAGDCCYGVGAGAGLYDAGTGTTVTNCVFAGNAAYTGGGMYSESTTVNNCTFWGNSSVLAGGALAGSNDYVDAIVLTNCIVWGNSDDPHIQPDYGIGNQDIDNIWILGSRTYSHSNITEDEYGVNVFDPMFVDDDLDDGTVDLHLNPGSPAIDRGNDEAAPSADYEGHPRYDDPSVANCGDPDGEEVECAWISDMGAYEYQGDSE